VNPVVSLDRLVDQAFDSIRGVVAVDKVMYAASAAGDHSLLWHGIGLAEAAAAGRPRRAVGFALVIGTESAIVNGGLKTLFRRARPVHDLPRPHHLRTPRTSSFPSGHASSAMTAAALLSARRPRLRPLWYALGLVVAASRIHVRIHHASDVLAGLAVGVVLGRLGVAVLRRLPR
jgi:membrane-associated phospholipid phosphatase